MNCKKVEGQLQELLDGGLDRRMAAQAQAHLGTCVSCAGRYEILRSIALSLKTIPYYQVSPRFNQKILAALGHSVNRAVLPSWVKGTVAFLLFLVSGWMTLLLVKGMAALNPLKIVQALEYLLHPARLSLLVKTGAVKAGLALIHLLSTWNEAGMPFGPGNLGPQVMPQIILSSLLAGGLIVFISRNKRSKESGRFA